MTTDREEPTTHGAARRRDRPPTHPHLRLRRAASELYGVSGRSEAARLGVAASTYDDWCAVEGVVRAHRGVVVLPDAPDVPERAIAAAIVAGGPGTVAGGATASFLHDLRHTPPGRVTVLIPHQRRARDLDGVEVVRTRHLDATDLTTIRRLGCTTVERTVLDLVGVVGWGDDGLALVLTALQRSATDVTSLRRTVERAGRRRGRPLGRVLELLGDRTPDSIFEHLVACRLRAAGLDPVVGFDVVVDGRRRRIDLAFPDVRVAVECDGFAFHRRPRDLARDHERQNALVRAGWRVLRVSWHAWTRSPGDVVGEIRSLVAA